MSVSAIPARTGVRLDAEKLDHQLGLRGITARELAERSGIPEHTISRARHGRPVNESTLRRLSTALLEIPLFRGIDLLIAEPPGMKIAGGSASPAISKEVSRVRGTTSARV
jgi:transcriptional regulator with XRE-family HTH domain